MSTELDFENKEGPSVVQRDYKELTGSLLYVLTRTRPDISTAVGMLCRYSAEPREQHMADLKRNLRYLKRT